MTLCFHYVPHSPLVKNPHKRCQCESALCVTSPCRLQGVLELKSTAKHHVFVPICICQFCSSAAIVRLHCCSLSSRGCLRRRHRGRCAPSPLPVPPAVCGHTTHASAPPSSPSQLTLGLLSSTVSVTSSCPSLLHLLTRPRLSLSLSHSPSSSSPVGGVPGVRL